MLSNIRMNQVWNKQQNSWKGTCFFGQQKLQLVSTVRGAGRSDQTRHFTSSVKVENVWYLVDDEVVSEESPECTNGVYLGLYKKGGKQIWLYVGATLLLHACRLCKRLKSKNSFISFSFEISWYSGKSRAWCSQPGKFKEVQKSWRETKWQAVKSFSYKILSNWETRVDQKLWSWYVQIFMALYKWF